MVMGQWLWPGKMQLVRQSVLLFWEKNASPWDVWSPSETPFPPPPEEGITEGQQQSAQVFIPFCKDPCRK